MMQTSGAHLALRALTIRAFSLYVLLRLMLGTAAAAARLAANSPSVSNRSAGPNFDNPVGIIILVTVLGALDIRRRNEQLLWGNLGYSRSLLWGTFAAVALIGELALGLLRS